MSSCCDVPLRGSVRLRSSGRPASKKRSKASGKQPMANDLPSVEQLRDYSSYELQELRARHACSGLRQGRIQQQMSTILQSRFHA